MLMKHIWMAYGGILLLSGCSNGDGEDVAEGLSKFPQSVEKMTARHEEQILETQYLSLSETDQALWLKVYASVWKLGFDKARETDGVDYMKMSRSEGNASNDTYYSDIEFNMDVSHVNFDSLIPTQCADEAFILAMNQGLTLETQYISKTGESLAKTILNAKICNLNID